MTMHPPPVLDKPVPAERRRRLSDRIEEAFDQACGQGNLEVAACMLKGLDLALLGQPLPWDRRQAAVVLLRACQARLQSLRDARTAGQPEESLARPNGAGDTRPPHWHAGADLLASNG